LPGSTRPRVPLSMSRSGGMIFFAKAGTDSAKKDISTIAIGSLIGIIALLLLTFRSLMPMLLTLFSALTGFIAAFVVTAWLFDTVYLFTLSFGICIIGICVDYAFFYYADRLLGGRKWQASVGLRRIFSALTLGLINIVIAYTLIAITPFPGLRQLAVFAITGLIMAYLTVICLFPMILKPVKREHFPLILPLSSTFLTFWQKAHGGIIALFFLLIFVTGIIGMSRLKANDDVRILESMPPQLKMMDEKVRTIIGSHYGFRFLFIEAKTESMLLAREQTIVNTLKQRSGNKAITAISQYLPDEALQRQNFKLSLASINQRLETYLSSIGVEEEKIAKIISDYRQQKFKPLTMDEWLKSPVSDNFKNLWLGSYDGHYVSVVMLSTEIPAALIDAVIKDKPYATYINKAEEVSSLFKHFRQKISLLLYFALAALFMLLLIRYRSVKKAMLLSLPPLMALMSGIAVLGLLNIPLTLFSILALILILGISVDYVVFFAESSRQPQSTMLAVLLSALTTILSFGLLAFSHTPVVHYFGVTLFAGITMAFICSPFAARIQKKESP
ncbi:MAG: MMPL family transporter, partial [Francisellaceae bacterium]